MRRLILIFSLLAISISAFAQIGKVSPSRFKNAPGAGYIHLSNGTGEFESVLLDTAINAITSFVSGDSIFIIGPNGDTTFVGNVTNIYNGISDTTTVIFADSSGVDAAVPCYPTLAEIDSFNMAQVPPVVNGIIYFNCTNDSTAGETYVYYVDGDTNILILEAPLIDTIQIRRLLIPSPAFAVPEAPTEAEAIAFARSRPGGVLPGTILVQGEGALPMSQSPDNPATSWFFDGINTTRIKDFPRKVEIPSSAFADPDNPTVTEVYTWIAANQNYYGNYWEIYHINSGSIEDPDHVFRVAGDETTARTDIFLIKKPATVTGAATDLSLANRTATTNDVLSSTGADVTLQPATESVAGLKTAADQIKTNYITVTEAVNLDSVPVAWSFAPLTALTTITFNNGNSITYASNEVLYFNGVLSGIASHVLGIDYNTGIIYYRNGAGNWAAAPSGGGSGTPQTLANSSDATSHTVVLSDSGGSITFQEGTNVDLETSGDAGNGTLTINLVLSCTDSTWSNLDTIFRRSVNCTLDTIIETNLGNSNQTLTANRTIDLATFDMTIREGGGGTLMSFDESTTNVGIGTGTPNASYALTIQDDNFPLRIQRSNGTDVMHIKNVIGNGAFYSSGGRFLFSNTDSGSPSFNMDFLFTSSAGMRLKSTTAGGAILVIDGFTGTQNTLRFAKNGVTSWDFIGATDTSMRWLNASGTAIQHVGQDGDFAIGTNTAPAQARLEVQNSTDNVDVLRLDNSQNQELLSLDSLGQIHTPKYVGGTFDQASPTRVYTLNSSGDVGTQTISTFTNNLLGTTANVTTSNSPYTLTANDGYIIADASSGNITINLNTAGKQEIYVVRIDNTANIVSVAGNGKNILGAATDTSLNAQWSSHKYYNKTTVWTK